MLFIKLQYASTFKVKPELTLEIQTLPLDVEIYAKAQTSLKEVLGVFYDTDAYMATKKTQKHLFFDKFCFDLVSMLGKNVFRLSVEDVEFLWRASLFALSHRFNQDKGFRLLLKPLESPFSAEKVVNLNQALNKKSSLITNLPRASDLPQAVSPVQIFDSFPSSS